MADYEFRYSPLTGRLTGKQMIEQTEQAINALASQVDSAAGQVEIISTLANEANENAATALEVANEALATTGRTYITVSTQTDANNYYDSQLIYIADSTSTNIPVADTGMLEVKTNDNKTACEQVFISDSSGDAYYRNGAITAETVGDVTTYSVTWSGWSSQPASQAYVQGELTNYLPLSGGTLTGDVDITGNLSVSGAITGNVTGNVTGTASGNLPLSGGSITGDVDITGDLSVSDLSVSGDLDVTSAITCRSVKSNHVNVRSGSVAPVNTLQRSTEYSVDDIVYTSKLNAKYYLLCVTAGTTSATMPSLSGAGSNTEVTDGTVVWRVQTITSQESVETRISKSGLPVGFEAFTTNPTLQAGWLPLLGGEYSRTTYADLWAWVQTQNGYLLEESAWQAKAAANGGNVPFYSKGDGSTTFRVPALKCWVKGTDGSAQLVGSYLEAGLPNIVAGKITTQDWGGVETQLTGAWVETAHNTKVANTNKGTSADEFMFTFDASRSNSIYGNSDTVQPESIVGMWVVKAYGTVTNAGSTDVANISTGLTQAETRISALENHGAGATVVESYRNGTEWYRVWSDGWIEQGGIISSMHTGNINNTTNYSTITLPKAFADTKYIVSVMVNSLTQTSATDTIVTLNEKNTTNFKTRNFDSDNALQVSASWFACGKGA